MATIKITHRRTKTFKDVSVQCERIVTMHLRGYGTDKMYEFCERVYFKLLTTNGY
jgi:hypothetical protein